MYILTFSINAECSLEIVNFEYIMPWNSHENKNQYISLINYFTGKCIHPHSGFHQHDHSSRYRLIESINCSPIIILIVIICISVFQTFITVCNIHFNWVWLIIERKADIRYINFSTTFLRFDTVLGCSHFRGPSRSQWLT